MKLCGTAPTISILGDFVIFLCMIFSIVLVLSKIWRTGCIVRLEPTAEHTEGVSQFSKSFTMSSAFLGLVFHSAYLPVISAALASEITAHSFSNYAFKMFHQRALKQGKRILYCVPNKCSGRRGVCLTLLTANQSKVPWRGALSYRWFEPFSS